MKWNRHKYMQARRLYRLALHYDDQIDNPLLQEYLLLIQTYERGRDVIDMPLQQRLSRWIQDKKIPF